MSKKRITVQIPDKAGSDLISRKKQKLTKKPEPESESEDNSSEENISDESGFDSDASIVDDEDEDDDELDIDGVSSDDDEAADQEDSDSDDDIPKLKKKKKNHDDGSESFATAVTAILGSKLKAYDRKDPILARSKQTLKKLESDKLEAKARRELLAEKKRIYDQDRIRDLYPKDDGNARAILDHERKLKKVAQRGVIRLFNVVMSTQTRATSEVNRTKVLGEEKKEQLMTELSKEKFFDLVKAAGDK